MVTHTMVKVLRDPLLSAHYQSAVQTAVDVCCGLGFSRLTSVLLQNSGGMANAAGLANMNMPGGGGGGGGAGGAGGLSGVDG
ncbi:unnamed protein product, partial [Ectocarpus sp. 12 AP-2014]